MIDQDIKKASWHIESGNRHVLTACGRSVYLYAPGSSPAFDFWYTHELGQSADDTSALMRHASEESGKAYCEAKLARDYFDADARATKTSSAPTPASRPALVPSEEGDAVSIGEVTDTFTRGKAFVQAWRYRLSLEYGNWGVVYVEADGRFMTHSSFGAYAFAFSAPGADFRLWFADLIDHEVAEKGEYLLGKISKQDHFDSEAAHAWLAKHLGKDEDEVDSVGDENDLHDRAECDYGDVPDFTTFSPNAFALRDRLLPRLAKLIRAQLAAETEADDRAAVLSRAVATIAPTWVATVDGRTWVASNQFALEWPGGATSGLREYPGLELLIAEVGAAPAKTDVAVASSMLHTDTIVIETISKLFPLGQWEFADGFLRMRHDGRIVAITSAIRP